MARDPFVGPQHLPREGDEVYVGWIDLMGIADAMSRSYQTAATNVGKLCAAIADHNHVENMTVYPMVDGLYILSEDVEELALLMANTFHRFGAVTHERERDPTDGYGPWLGFLIRGGVSHGTVYHGADFDENGDSDLADIDWLDHVPFGEPIANAHNVERGAAPYSIVLHESATDDPRAWKWWDIYDDDIRDQVVEYLDAHFQWAMANIDDLLYEDNMLYHHAEEAEDFFELPDGYFDLD